jgi:hypothetical protein
MGHILVIRWALEVGEDGYLSQFLTGSLVVSVFKPPFSRIEGQIHVSGSRCLIHWSSRHKSCDKGLEAVEKQPWSATIMAMT